jgi:hypothetical protein
MGTSGAYTGAGGKPGRDISSGVGDWINGLGGGPDGGAGGGAPVEGAPPSDRPPTELPPRLIEGLLSLLRPSISFGGSSSGPGAGGGRRGRQTSSRIGAGGGGGGLRRNTTQVSGSAGRAGAAAYAYATGDRATLQSLGLDYDTLRRLGDFIEITRRLVEAACGPLSNGTLEEHEERYVAASVAEWVLEQTEAGGAPTPEEIARYSIASVIAEVLATEINRDLQEHPESVAEVAESELFSAAEIVASKAELSIEGASPEELSEAIESGIETLREIYGAGGS